MYSPIVNPKPEAAYSFVEDHPVFPKNVCKNLLDFDFKDDVDVEKVVVVKNRKYFLFYSTIYNTTRKA